MALLVFLSRRSSHCFGLVLPLGFCLWRFASFPVSFRSGFPGLLLFLCVTHPIFWAGFGPLGCGLWGFFAPFSWFIVCQDFLVSPVVLVFCLNYLRLYLVALSIP